MSDIRVITFIFIVPLLILVGFFLSLDLVKAYNTQQDRLMFVKTYEIVVECRKSYSLNDTAANRICGELPVFVDAVK